jgi:hypothetical protein
VILLKPRNGSFRVELPRSGATAGRFKACIAISLTQAGESGGLSGGTKQTIGAVTEPSACWDEADTPSTGRPRSRTHLDALLTRRDGQSCLRTWESGEYRMKYLLNLPLAVAALLQVWFSSLVFMSTP